MGEFRECIDTEAHSHVVSTKMAPKSGSEGDEGAGG